MALVEGRAIGSDGGASVPAASPRALITTLLAAPSKFLDAERERGFNWVPVCFGLGIASYFWLSDEPSLAAVLVPLALAVVLRILGRRGTFTSVFTSALLCAASGLVIAKLRTEWVRAPVLADQLRNVEVRGFIELVEPKPTGGQRLTIRVASIGQLPMDKLPLRVRVRTKGTLAGVKPGDAVRLVATLGPPAGPALPGGFDFGRQAWFLGIGGNGYSMTAAQIDGSAGPLPWQMWEQATIERIRQRIGRAVVAGLNGETGGIANALITGERGGISAATDSAYRDSGLYHILSISGLHMVVMAGAFFFVVRFAFAAFPSIALRYPIKRWAAFAAALGALGYLLISGGSFATVRSYVQISIIFLAMMLERPALALRNVAIAATLLLVAWPESLFDAGFQMSFAAVVALISVYEALRQRAEKRGRDTIRRGRFLQLLMFLGGIMGSTVIATLSVAPFAAYQFHTSQQYGALANLVALPICDLFVMPAALATLLVMPFGLEWIPLRLAGLGIDAMTWIAYGVAKLPGAVIPVVAIPTSAFALMVSGGLWLLLWQTRGRLLGLPMIALGLALAPGLERPDLIVSRDGTLIAARVDGPNLSALPAPRSLYDLARWLEADGDQRKPQDVSRGQGFRCDAAGCTGSISGQLVAVTRHASALPEDCARAVILVLHRPRPAGCTKPLAIIDWPSLRREGTHAVFLPHPGGFTWSAWSIFGAPTSPHPPATPGLGGKSNAVMPVVRIETVAQVRGNRPWSAMLPTTSTVSSIASSSLNAAPAGSVSPSSSSMQTQAPAPYARRRGIPPPVVTERLRGFALPAANALHELWPPEFADDDDPPPFVEPVRDFALSPSSDPRDDDMEQAAD